MTKKEQNILEKLLYSVLTECSIQCDKCKDMKSDYGMDDITFAEKIMRLGWTFNRGAILCSNCNNSQKPTK